MKINSAVHGLFHADRQTDRHGEGNRRILTNFQFANVSKEKYMKTNIKKLKDTQQKSMKQINNVSRRRGGKDRDKEKIRKQNVISCASSSHQ
jgi:hypothetical protein